MLSKNLRLRKKKRKAIYKRASGAVTGANYSKLARVEARKSEAAIWRANEREKERERERERERRRNKRPSG